MIRPHLNHQVLVAVVVTITLLVMPGCSIETSGSPQGQATIGSGPQQVTQTPVASNSRSPAGSTSDRPTTDTSLDGDWTVRALVGTSGQSVLSASAIDKMKLTFARGDMTGTTVCNSVWGTYEQGGAQDLRFFNEKLGTTLVACRDEPPLTSRLLDVRHVSGSSDVRYLHAENWMIIAELRRAT